MVYSRCATQHGKLLPTCTLVLALLLPGLLAGTACHGQIIYSWANPAGGSYTKTSNWVPTGVPDSNSESARFKIDADYDVLLASDTTTEVNDLEVLNGRVNFGSGGFASATYQVSDTTFIEGGDFLLDQFTSGGFGSVHLATSELRVSQDSTFTVDTGSSATVNGPIRVGDFTSDTVGTIVVRDGGSLHLRSGAVGALQVGLNSTTPTTPSTVRVTGAGSSIGLQGNDAQIGVNHQGLLEVLDGASLLTPDGEIRVALSTDSSSDGSNLKIDGGSLVSVVDSSDQSFGSTFVSNGSFSSGSLEVLGASLFEAGEFTISAAGTASVDGSGSRLQAEAVDVRDDAIVVVQNGAELSISPDGGSHTISDRGALTITGPGSRLLGNRNNQFSLGGTDSDSPAQIEVSGGAVVEPSEPEYRISATMDNASRISVSGPGSVFNAGTNSLLQMSASVGSEAHLHVADGAAATFGAIAIGLSDSFGRITVDSGQLTVAFDMELGASIFGGVPTDLGAATVDLLPGGVLEVGRDLVVGSEAALNLAGGELRVPELSDIHVVDPAGINWSNGTLRPSGNTTLTPTVADKLLPNGSLDFGQRLEIPGTLTLQSPLALDGGTLAVAGLENGQLLQLQSGRLEWEGSLEVGPSGPLGEYLDLPQGLTVAVADDLIVSGVLTGEGRVEATLDTTTTGQLRIEPSERLTITARLTNAGDVQLQSGRLDVETSINNTATGNILGRGTISTVDGLLNQGDLALSNGQTDIFGGVENMSTGRIQVSGNADVTFWDDVVHNGSLFNVSAGSSVTFFGQAGFGVTGGGDVFFEADVSPGSSPGDEHFGGNVHFGAASRLEIELAGTVPGEMFDVLTIAGSATLDGTLEVSLLDGFVPELGDSFTFLTADGGLQGTFADQQLPDLGPLLTIATEYDANTARLTVVPALAGDFNVDGVVDAADYTVWRDTDASPTGYAAWKANFGQSIVAGSLASQPVPEPASLAIAAMTVALLGGARRRGASTAVRRQFARRRFLPCSTDLPAG